jgi:hypothetical protein
MDQKLSEGEVSDSVAVEIPRYARSAPIKKGGPAGQKAWARTDMDYDGNRWISYDFSPVLL